MQKFTNHFKSILSTSTNAGDSVIHYLLLSLTVCYMSFLKNN